MGRSLYLIGNGFDLHLNLPTRYYNYKNHLQKLDPKLVDKIDKIIIELLNLYSYSESDINSVKEWSKLEEYLGLFHELDFDSWFEEAITYSQSDSDRADYYFGPKIYADVMSKEYERVIFGIKKYFKSWVDSIDLKKAIKDETLMLDKGNLYFNFNYTNTLEYFYDIPSNNILYLHINRNGYVLGHNDTYNVPFEKPYISYVEKANGLEIPYEDEDPRNGMARESFNQLYDTVFKQYYKNSKNIIKANNKWFEEASKCNSLIIMGLKVGKEDEIYLKTLSKIMNTLEEVVFYYHSLEDEDHLEHVVSKYFNCRIRHIKW